MRVRFFICLALLFLSWAPFSLFAQSFEISPYAGYYWPGNNNGVGEFKNNQILGVRGGGFITPNFELGGNYSWSNHFQPSRSNEPAKLAGDLGFPQGSGRFNLWEAEFTYNFAKHNVFGSSVRPYVVAGGGGLRTKVKDPNTFVLNVRPGVKPCGCNGLVPNDVMDSGDWFFAFSYGGGVKATRLWGPAGLFADFRGRTIPNFFGHGTNWPELSAGLNFSWGER